MKMPVIYLVAMCIALTGGGLRAQLTSPASLPPILERLLGDWRGEGIVSGRRSALTMTWSTDLGGRFVHLRFRNEMSPAVAGPTELFESRGYYRAQSPTAGIGTWVDSRGVIFPLALAFSDTALTVDWGSEATERGRTRYALTATGIEITDFVRLADGQYRQFGSATFVRVPR